MPGWSPGATRPASRGRQTASAPFSSRYQHLQARLRVRRAVRFGARQRHRSNGQHHRHLGLTGSRLASRASERSAQRLVAVSFYLLAPHIAVETISALAAGDQADATIVGLVLTAGTAILEPGPGVAKRRIGARLGSAATVGEGTQNLLCAY